MSWDQNSVAAYVAAHPGCSARDVARDVLKGTGDTRTTARQKAYISLRALEAQGVVRREYGHAHTWWAVGVEEQVAPSQCVAVFMTAPHLRLLCRILECGLADGHLGGPTQALREHLQRERKRVDPQDAEEE